MDKFFNSYEPKFGTGDENEKLLNLQGKIIIAKGPENHYYSDPFMAPFPVVGNSSGGKP